MRRRERLIQRLEATRSQVSSNAPAPAPAPPNQPPNQPPPPGPVGGGGGGSAGGGSNQPNPNALLAAAITQLTQIIAQQQQPRVPIYDPYDPTQPFDLSNRVGNEAYNNAKAALNQTWDGTTAGFPEFLLSIRMRADDAKWDAPSPHGITHVPTGATDAQGNPVTAHLLTEYHLITDAMVTAANTARTDPRAIQNSRAFYHALKSSITGNLRTTVLDQTANTPSNEDGVSFFIKLLRFTELSSMSLSFDSTDKLLRFDPADYDFVIPDVNKALCNLVLLATTPQRPIPEPEQIQHAINAYKRIKQPEMWAQWVREQMESFRRGNLINIQPFLNSAVEKYNQIKSEHDGNFNASSTTIQEDVVAMITANTKKRKAEDKKDDKKEPDPSPDPKKPPFLRHFKHTAASDAPLYKVGDTKEWDGKTYYFCDATTHRDKVRWHLHAPDKCKVRARFLQNKLDNDRNPEANLVDDPPKPDDKSSLATKDTKAPTDDKDEDVASLLAGALVLAPDDNVRNVITDAMSLITDM